MAIWNKKKAKTEVTAKQGKDEPVATCQTPAPRGSTALPAPISYAEPVGEPAGEAEVLLGKPKLTSAPRQFPSGFESVPDSLVDGGEVDGLWVRAASTRGDDHRHYGEVRQDSFAVWALAPSQPAGPEEPVVLACVADGVGSEPLSHVGSSLACRLLRQELLPHAAAILDPTAGDTKLTDRCARVVNEVANRLKLEAHQRELTARALSTTLVAALVGGRSANGSRRVVYLAVGDSPAFRLRDSVFQPIFDSTDGGQITSTATAALPTQFDRVIVAEGEISPGDVMVLCTDGLSSPMRDSGVSKQLAQWWQPGPVPSLPEFYWQLSFRAQSYGDDRTAVCVWTP